LEKTQSDALRGFLFLHLRLTFLRLARRIRNFGLPPYPSMVLIALCFFGLSDRLFYKSDWAGYLIAFMGVSSVSAFSAASRDEFLLLLLDRLRLRKLRLIENLILSIPFLLVLVFHSAFAESLLLLTMSAALSLLRIKTNYRFVIPAPFPAYAFEFISGFRRTFFLFPLFFLLVPISFFSDNFNLGLLCIGLTSLILLGYFQKPEEEFFVWIYAENPFSFFRRKIRTALLCSFFTLFLPALALLILFPAKIEHLLSFYFFALIFISAIILVKYASFPSEAGLPEMLILGLCLYFPPAFLAVIPFFLFKSLRNLKPLLHD